MSNLQNATVVTIPNIESHLLKMTLGMIASFLAVFFYAIAISLILYANIKNIKNDKIMLDHINLFFVVGVSLLVQPFLVYCIIIAFYRAYPATLSYFYIVVAIDTIVFPIYTLFRRCKFTNPKFLALYSFYFIINGVILVFSIAKPLLPIIPILTIFVVTPLRILAIFSAIVFVFIKGDKLHIVDLTWKRLYLVNYFK